MSVKVEWSSGLQTLLQKFQDRPAKMQQAKGQALMMEGEELIAEAKPLTPVLHGNLRSSGFCQLPVAQGEEVSITAGFGGVAGTGNQVGDTNPEDVGYALYVHENLMAHHPVGQAKFLEQPFDERLNGMSDRLAGRIEAVLNK
jgi:hypothetical protein